MKRWFEWLWDSVVVITGCVTVITVGVLIGTYWQVTNELEAVGNLTERVSRQMDELEIEVQLLKGRVTALELSIWY